MDLTWCFIFTIGLVNNHLVQVTDGLPTTTTVQCLQESSKKCTVPIVNLTDPSDELVLPNLTTKTALHIKGGELAAFDGRLCAQLGAVRKLQFGQLELKQLCLTPQLREVSAAGNKIESVTFQSTGSQYNLQILNLRNNSLKDLEGFNVLVSLVEVHLENNALESFEWAVFENMAKLEKLYLNGNNLQSVTAKVQIELPVLDYLSLANNQLTSLNVTKWKFESLSKFDFSSNNLSKVEGLSRFPSVQDVLMAKNKWHCEWLQGTLEYFKTNLVTIKDRDKHCQGITPANICCSPENDSITEDKKLQEKLANLEKDQKETRSELEAKFTELKNKKDNELSDLEKRLKLVAPPSPAMNVTSNSSSQYTNCKQKLQEVESTADKELEQLSLQKHEKEAAQRRVTYTVLELKMSVERGKKTIKGLQAQFRDLRSHINKIGKNRD